MSSELASALFIHRKARTVMSGGSSGVMVSLRRESPRSGWDAHRTMIH